MKVWHFLIFIFLIQSSGIVAQNKSREIGAFPESVDSSTFVFKDKLLVFPLTALSTETSWVFGVANVFLFKTSKRDSTLRISTMPSGFLYTLNKQILIAIGANIFLPKEKYIIRFENTFSKFPDKFWGIGNNTPESAAESYTFSQFYINPQLHKKIKRNFFLGAGWDYQHVFDIAYDSAGNFAQQEVVGIYNRSQYQVSGYSFFAMHDSRNHTYMPNKGSLLRIKFSNFNQHVGSDYNFQGLEIDFRKFIKIRSSQTLAMQYLSTFTFGEVPYRNLALLGGNAIMRGYYGGRYRDRKFLGAQVEYRFPIYWRLGGTTFASAGQVADQLNDFHFGGFKLAGGVGLRFAVLPSEKLNLRFDVAHGESLNYYIVLAEAF